MKSAFYEDGDLEIGPYIIVLVILVMCRVTSYTCDVSRY